MASSTGRGSRMSDAPKVHETQMYTEVKLKGINLWSSLSNFVIPGIIMYLLIFILQL